MRIIHIITGLNDGGAEGALFRLCSNDVYNKHIVVSLLSGGKYVEKLDSVNIQTYSLRLNTVSGFFSCILKLKKICKDFKPDVIQTWLYHADFFGGLCTYLFGYRNIIWNIRNCNTSAKALKFSTRLIVSFNAVISKYIPKKIISASEAAAIHHASLGYPITKISVVPNGYTETINSNMSPDLLEIRHKSYFLIGMVARFDQQKDHKNLFAALSLLKTKNIDFECILVGTGMTSLNTHLITMIENYNIQDKIQLLGQRDDVDSVMKILDLHVLSSLGEAFPNVLVEAMLGETLCVSTDVGDARYILNGQGWIVEPENPKALHSAIIAAFNLFSTDKNNWVTKSKMVKQYARNRFSIDNMVKQYNEVWNG